MTQYLISEAAELLGVSDDTVRRWVVAGKLSAHKVDSRQVIEGTDLAEFAQRQVHPDTGEMSARNRLRGIVTAVKFGEVMAQVDIAAGRYRLVSLMSREAAEELGLVPGVLATAVVKATTVIVETESSHG